MEPQLAIIRNLRIGVGDRDVPVITFETYINESVSALQCIYGADNIYNFISQAGRADILSLNGTPCWVQRDQNILWNRDE